jgi:hypothetical protein
MPVRGSVTVTLMLYTPVNVFVVVKTLIASEFRVFANVNCAGRAELSAIVTE